MDNPEEMDKFSEKYNLPRLNQDEREKINWPITRTEIVGSFLITVSISVLVIGPFIFSISSWV